MKKLFNTSFNPVYLDLALFFVRIIVGCFMLVHGWPKLQQLLAGGEIEFADPLGLGARTSLILTVFVEVFCSVFVIFGFATRLFLVPLVFTMIVIIFVVHTSDGFQKQEKALLYLMTYALLFVTGAGRYSLDRMISRKYRP